jgi:hypothetical protein
MLKRMMAAAAAAGMAIGGQALAQEGSGAAAAVFTADPAADPATAPPDAASQCELHVWSTQNYLGISTGLLLGFGAIGGLIEGAAQEGRTRTVKDLMREYLGPEIQLEEMNRVGLLQSLKLPATYRVIIEEPTPWNEDLKRDPALKARVAEMNKTLKAGGRLTSSQSTCYVELLTTMVFYHKAMMYGSNLFTGWIYRDFQDKPTVQVYADGAVKNPLEAFPPKTPEQVEAAKAELREAFVKDYNEWLAKKFSAAAPPKARRR